MEDDLLEKKSNNTQYNDLEDLSLSSIQETKSELESLDNNTLNNNEDSFSKLNIVKLKNRKSHKISGKSTEKNSKEDNLESLTLPETGSPITILDRFMNYVEGLIKKLVGKIIGFLENNHESNLNFFLELLFKKRKRTTKEEDDEK